MLKKAKTYALFFIFHLLVVAPMNVNATLIKASTGEEVVLTNETTDLIIEMKDGQIIGAYNITTGSTLVLYDVALNNSTFYNAYTDEGSLLPLNESVWLSRALATEVFRDFSWANFNSNTLLTLGCNSLHECTIWTAYSPSIGPSNARVHGFHNFNINNSDRFDSKFMSKDYDLSNSDVSVYAVWTPSSTRRTITVNEPNTIFSCVFFLFFFRKKLKIAT